MTQRGGPPRPLHSLLLPFDDPSRAAAVLADARRRAHPFAAPEPSEPTGQEAPHDPAAGKAGPHPQPPAPAAPDRAPSAGAPIPKVCDCGAPIFWAEVEATGKRMPVDAQVTLDGNVILYRRGTAVMARVLKRGEEPPLGARLRKAHFATCPNASKHRRRA